MVYSVVASSVPLLSVPVLRAAVTEWSDRPSGPRQANRPSASGGNWVRTAAAYVVRAVLVGVRAAAPPGPGMATSAAASLLKLRPDALAADEALLLEELELEPEPILDPNETPPPPPPPPARDLDFLAVDRADGGGGVVTGSPAEAADPPKPNPPAGFLALRVVPPPPPNGLGAALDISGKPAAAAGAEAAVAGAGEPKGFLGAARLIGGKAADADEGAFFLAGAGEPKLNPPPPPGAGAAAAGAAAVPDDVPPPPKEKGLAGFFLYRSESDRKSDIHTISL